MKIKNLILAAVVLFTALFITIITYFAAFTVTVIIGDVNVTEPGTASVNQGIFNLFRYILSFTVFGFWYSRIKSSSFFDEDYRKRLRSQLHPVLIILMLILGFAIQICTDGVLYILSKQFPESMESYNSLMAEFLGAKSVLFIITAIFMAPIVEELIFRGLILHYCRLFTGSDKDQLENRNYTLYLIIANLLQALFFGLYHGNWIQGTYAFIFGILLGFIAIKTDSLMISTLLHIIINGSLYIVSEELFTDVPKAYLISFIAFIVLILSYTMLLIFLSRKTPHKNN